MIATTKNVSEFFGVTTRQVGNWVEAGCPKDGRGRFNLQEVFNWWRDNINAGDDETINAVKIDYWKAKAEGERIKVEKEKGSLMPRAEIITAWTWRVSEVRNGLLAWKDRLSTMLSGKSQKEIADILDKETWILLDNFSREGKFCKKTQPKKSPGPEKNSKPADRRKSSRSTSGRKSTSNSKSR